MKQEISPVVAAIIVVVVVVVIGAVYWLRGGRVAASNQPPPGMPPDVQAEFQRRLGGTTGPAGAPNPGGTPMLPRAGQGGGQ